LSLRTIGIFILREKGKLIKFNFVLPSYLKCEYHI
jgi:hypothetical protein